MATRDDIYTAIKNADAAGDSESVRKLGAYLQTMGTPAASAAPMAPKSAMDQFYGEEGGTTGLRNFVGKNALMGAVRGAAGIGATIMQPFQALEDKLTGRGAPTLGGLVTGQQPMSSNQATRAGIDGGVAATGADPNSYAFKAGKLAAEVGGTSGVGGVLAAPVRALGPAVAPLAEAIGSSGFTTGARAAPGLIGQATNLGTRALGGAISGGATVGLVDPDHAGSAALIGAALPPAIRAAGAAGTLVAQKVGNALAVSPEVAALAQRANELGIQIPADRIANSKPLNAFASSLNYVPLSGRAAVEQRMEQQMNRHLSTLVGQDSPNMTMALRQAEGDLGKKFEDTLKNNAIDITPTLLNSMAGVQQKAARELGSSGLQAINGQVDEIMAKGINGQIDGQAAYNIKRDLDRIGERNGPEAYHARELKRVLMDGLNESLGPQKAAAFAKTREQYGNMLDLQALAKNGAEGDISIARLANMKNIGNPQMQEAADIAAQFLKAREGNHGAMQRVVAGGALVGTGHALGGALGGGVGLAGTAALGRGASMALDSDFARNLLLNPGANAAAANQLGTVAGPNLLRAGQRQAAN